MTEIFNPIDSVELIYTQKCNINCAHCVNDCGPHKKGKLDFNRVLLLLKSMPEFKVKQLGITGGEPILHLNEILKVLSVTKKYGIKSKLISNGFWGSTKKRAEEIVFKLSSAGLNALNISTDEFHLRFIPSQNILNILDAARKQKGFKVILRVVYSKNYSFFEFISKHKEYFNKIKSDKKPFLVLFQPLIPIGRAFENIPKEDYVTAKKEITKRKCPFLHHPVINHNGKCLICCNIFEVSNTAFELGDFNSVSPKKLIESYQKSLFVFYQRIRGPDFLIKLAEKHNLNKVNKTKKLLDGYVGLCDYCVLNLDQYSMDDINNMLLKEFKKDKKLQKIAEKEIKKFKKKNKI